MDLYYYNLNSKLTINWTHAKILSYNKFKELSMNCDEIRFYNFTNPCNIILNGGWHLSFFGDSNFIQNKIHKYAHQELNVEPITNIQNIEYHINNFTDIINRNNMNIIKLPIKNNTYLPPEYERFLKKFIVVY